MTHNYRHVKNIERLEDVVFNLETPLVTQLANGAFQKKKL